MFGWIFSRPKDDGDYTGTILETVEQAMRRQDYPALARASLDIIPQLPHASYLVEPLILVAESLENNPRYSLYTMQAFGAALSHAGLFGALKQRALNGLEKSTEIAVKITLAQVAAQLLRQPQAVALPKPEIAPKSAAKFATPTRSHTCRFLQTIKKFGHV